MLPNREANCALELRFFATLQKYQLDRISLHDSKRATYEHTRKCAENLMLLGQTDRAVQLLLETDADNDQYYTDCLRYQRITVERGGSARCCSVHPARSGRLCQEGLVPTGSLAASIRAQLCDFKRSLQPCLASCRACLVASIRSSGASQSTIKLVATNLIANGKLSEGVQLLCLIDKGLDACRYLQTYGQWHQAAWLAKVSGDRPCEFNSHLYTCTLLHLFFVCRKS